MSTTEFPSNSSEKTPAGRGDITPAVIVAATSLAACSTAADMTVVEPPPLADAPAAAGSDEITVEELFSQLNEPDAEDDSDPCAFPRSRNGRLVCAASTDGQVTIHRHGSGGLALTAEEARTVYEFLADTAKVWGAAL